MSWVAASLLILGLALVAGFAWYERSHPSARVLALVATLAALAALGCVRSYHAKPATRARPRTTSEAASQLTGQPPAER